MAACNFRNTAPADISASASSPLAGAAPDIQNTFSATSILDHTGGEWIVLGYQDERGQPAGAAGVAPSGHTMGLATLDAHGTWRSYPQLGATSAAGIGTTDGGWLASPPQGGSVAYYVGAGERNPGDGIPSGLYMTLVDASASVTTATNATPQFNFTGPIAVGTYGDAPVPAVSTQWYEPTVAATHPQPGPDHVIVAACDVNDRPNPSQRSLFIWVSVDGGSSYHAAPHRVFAPGITEATPPQPPMDSTLRPVLQQDPRPGHECTEYLAYAVLAPSQVPGTACAPPNPPCQQLEGVAEATSLDCGETWSAPSYIAAFPLREGTVPGTGGRNFSYVVGDTGARYLAWVKSSSAGDALQILSAAPDQGFAFSSGAGVVAATAAGTARALPTVAAAHGAVVITYQELAAGGVLRIGAAVGSTALTVWTTQVLAPGGWPACPTSDTELGALDVLIPQRALIDGFLAVWTQAPPPVCNASHFHAFSSELTVSVPSPVTNACGGTVPLGAVPGSPCEEGGQCGRWTCLGSPGNAVTCNTSSTARNQCGGCNPMLVPGTEGGRGHSCICPNGAESGVLVCGSKRGSVTPLICCPCGSAPGCGPGSP